MEDFASVFRDIISPAIIWITCILIIISLFISIKVKKTKEDLFARWSEISLWLKRQKIFEIVLCVFCFMCFISQVIIGFQSNFNNWIFIIMWFFVFFIQFKILSIVKRKLKEHEEEVKDFHEQDFD